jgi:hypothetical protein
MSFHTINLVSALLCQTTVRHRQQEAIYTIKELNPPACHEV